MARVFVPFLAVVVLILSGCGEPTAESVAKETVDKMKELTTILKGITDEASANAAKPKLEALGKDLKELKAQSEKVEKTASAEEREAVKKKYEPEVQKVMMEELLPEMMRIGTDPKLSGILDSTLKDTMPE